MLDTPVGFYNGLLPAGLIAPVVGVIFDTSVCDFHDCTPEVVGFLGPFLQSFASQHPASVLVLMTSTNSVLCSIEGLIFSIKPCASSQVRRVASKNDVMG